MNSLFHATFSWLSAVVVSFKNSLVFTQDAWPMQAWIPVVSSSLYFWKSVFNFRVDSIFSWRVYIKLKVSWLRAFLLMHKPDKPSCTNSRRELKRNCWPIGHNNREHFLCPIRSQHSLDLLEMVRWESVPRGSSTHAWKLSSQLLSRPDWLPLGLRGWDWVHGQFFF